MALSAKALTTVAKAQALPGLSHVDVLVLEDLIEEASERFAQECDREVYRKSGHVEWVSGFGGRLLRIRDHAPVEEVDEIVYSTDGGATTTLVDASDYSLDALDRTERELGYIARVSGRWKWTSATTQDIVRDPLPGSERPFYRVTYTGGWVTPQQAADDVSLTRTLPRDIERAVLDHAISLLFARGRNPSVASRTTPRGSVQFNESEPGLPRGYAEVVSRYRWLR